MSDVATRRVEEISRKRLEADENRQRTTLGRATAKHADTTDERLTRDRWLPCDDEAVASRSTTQCRPSGSFGAEATVPCDEQGFAL